MYRVFGLLSGFVFAKIILNLNERTLFGSSRWPVGGATANGHAYATHIKFESLKELGFSISRN